MMMDQLIRRDRYLFPLPNVKKNPISFYTVPEHTVSFFKETNFCNVVAWADLNAMEYQTYGLPVIKPEEIKDYDCDQIVVASSYGQAQKEIYKSLSQMFPDRRIELFDMNLI